MIASLRSRIRSMGESPDRLVTALWVWNAFDVLIHVVSGQAELLRITANVVVLAAASAVRFGVVKRRPERLIVGAIAAFAALNAVFIAGDGAAVLMIVLIAVTVLLGVWAARALRTASDVTVDREHDVELPRPWFRKRWVRITGAVLVVAVAGLVAVPRLLTVSILRQATNGRLDAADYWVDEPVILSAGMGFDNILGIAGADEQSVRDAGGAWYGSLACSNGDEPDDTQRSAAVAASTLNGYTRGFTDFDDGVPIVFSWPIATDTAHPDDFRFTLNTGETVVPNGVTMFPNWETNERNTIVALGDFGNRGRGDEPDAQFPVRLEIVDDGTPLLLIGPDGQEFDAVGLTWETDATPYDSGPKLVGAKLNHVGDQARGDGGIKLIDGAPYLPNDEFALYGGGDFRLRMLTSGGFSPDGITGLTPDRFEDFFRIHATGVDGETVLIDTVGVDYDVAGGTLRVVGLSDLGRALDEDGGVFYDDCYAEDRDNYIDVILTGDEAAARNVTFLEIPSLGSGYDAFYNPGGPGPEPTAGERYTAPGPPDLEPVVIALDDPMRTDRD